MDQFAIFFWVVIIAGFLCSLFGVLLVASPKAVHKLNAGISRSIISFDASILKYSRYAGVSFLVVGIALLYMIFRIL